MSSDFLFCVHNVLIVINVEIKICQNYWENGFELQIYPRRREMMFKWRIHLCSNTMVCPILFLFSNSSTDENKTEHKPLSYIIIKVSWLLFLLTLFLAAEGTGQIYSLWHSNQFPSIFFREFNYIGCPRTMFKDSQCVNMDLFWPATVSLPSFISSSIQRQSWNFPQLKIILNWTIDKLN